MRWARMGMLATCMAAALCTSANNADSDGYAITELRVDTLPPLNTARAGHVTLCLDGELTVLGGHARGFVPEATAEYFRDGAWHTVPLVYPHDQGAAVVLRSGKVFLGGGHKEPLGIGQLFSAELYDPSTHSTHGFGCMDRKRAYANAVEMADGEVVISGNWFADDGVEKFADVYNPRLTNAVGLKPTSQQRSNPYILRISDDDAIIFSSLDNKSEEINGCIVDRLKGPSYREPFFDTWMPLRTIIGRRSSNHFIGDESEGRYEWLLPVVDYETGDVAIARVEGVSDDSATPTFSLLPTQQKIPVSVRGKHITYGSMVCDRERGIAYLVGDDDEARVIVVAIPYYAGASAPLMVYVTDPQPFLAHIVNPVLTPEGDLVFAGGSLDNNFSPTNAVVRLPLGSSSPAAAAEAEGGAGVRWWMWVLIGCAVVGGAVGVAAMTRKKARQHPTDFDDNAIEKNLPKEDVLPTLYRRIEQIMEEQRLYLNPNLRATDVAASVGSNTAYVSAAINSQCGCSFSQFLTNYRIAHAQELMRRDPECKISTISAHSGFSTDSTFFRAFRASTGMSPKEWLAEFRNGDQP